MKVKVGDRVYDSKEIPIMIVMDQDEYDEYVDYYTQEKSEVKLLMEMGLPEPHSTGNYTYARFPINSQWTDDQVEAWMKDI
jgi:hypothetical protein